MISRIAPARLPEIAAKDTASYEVFRQIVRTVNQILSVTNVRIDETDTVIGDLTDESFVVMTVTADTPNARALTVDSTIIKTDGGAGTTVTLSRAALTGDVTTSANVATIANNAVTTVKVANDNITYAKIQNVSAASRLLGRGSAAGSGDVEELTVGSGLLISGTVLSASGSGITEGVSAGLNFWGAW